MLAVLFIREDVINLLLEMNADVNAENSKKHTAMDIARLLNLTNIILICNTYFFFVLLSANNNKPIIVS